LIQFLRQKLISIVATFFGITLITFFVTQLAPGDPTLMQTQMNPKMSIEAKQKLLELHGLDKPVWERYGHWLGGLLRLDFGLSFKDGEKAIHKIAKRVPITLLISFSSMLLILLIGIPLGVWGAVRVNSWVDHAIALFVLLGFSIPTFWLALLLMSYFGVTLHILPVSGLHALDYEYLNPALRTLDLAKHLILPILVSAVTGKSNIGSIGAPSIKERVMREVKSDRRIVVIKNAMAQ